MSPSLVLATGLIASSCSAICMGPLHCIVNPASRDHTCGKRWPKIITKLESRGFTVNTYPTERVGHAGEIAWKLRTDNVEGVIVAVGGDGTVHEVASALRGCDIPMGILPFGTGNDYAITQGISRKNMDEAIDVLVNGVDRRSLGGYSLNLMRGSPVRYHAPNYIVPNGSMERKNTPILESRQYRFGRDGKFG
jgi:NAD kinase